MQKFIVYVFMFFALVSGFTGCLHTRAIKPDDAERKFPSYVSGYYAIDPIPLEDTKNKKNDNKSDPDLIALHNVGSKSTLYTTSEKGEITYLISGSQENSG